MLKKYIVLLVVIFTIIIYSGCSYVAYKDYYSNTEDYSKIWELTGFHQGYEGISTFFPQSIDDVMVNNFFCRYDEQLPLGEGVQLFLEIQYDDETLFTVETERLSTLSVTCDEFFEHTGFSAYATCFGENFSLEYALVDQEQHIIYYIYLQQMPKDEIEFDHQLLPIGYTGFSEIEQESN